MTSMTGEKRYLVEEYVTVRTKRKCYEKRYKVTDIKEQVSSMFQLIRSEYREFDIKVEVSELPNFQGFNVWIYKKGTDFYLVQIHIYIQELVNLPAELWEGLKTAKDQEPCYSLRNAQGYCMTSKKPLDCLFYNDTKKRIQKLLALKPPVKGSRKVLLKRLKE